MKDGWDMGSERKLNSGEHAGKLGTAEPLSLCPDELSFTLLEVMGSPEGLWVVHDRVSQCVQSLHILRGTKQPYLAAPFPSSCSSSGSDCSAFACILLFDSYFGGS